MAECFDDLREIRGWGDCLADNGVKDEKANVVFFFECFVGECDACFFADAEFLSFHGS